MPGGRRLEISITFETRSSGEVVPEVFQMGLQSMDAFLYTVSRTSLAVRLQLAAPRDQGIHLGRRPTARTNISRKMIGSRSRQISPVMLPFCCRRNAAGTGQAADRRFGLSQLGAPLRRWPGGAVVRGGLTLLASCQFP